MKNLQQLMNEITEWSDNTFGNGKKNRQRTVAMVHHLSKEVRELIEALKKTEEFGTDDSVGIGEFGRQLSKTKFEFADCFMLLLDAASHFGMSASELIVFTKEKLEINKNRKWGKPDKNGVVEHIKHVNQ